MKRVQAMVSGKKKQCTKLPAPTPINKGAKEADNNAASNPKRPSQKPDIPPKQKDKKQIKDEIKTSSSSSSSSTPPATAVKSTVAPPSSSTTTTSSSSSTTTATPSTKVASTSSMPKGVTNKAGGGTRSNSKIPATSPKKTKDSEKPEMKEKTRKESTTSTDGKGNNKSKSSFLVRKLSLSSKDKQRKPVDIRNRSDSDTNRSTGGSSGGYNSSDEARIKPLPIRPDIELDSQGSVGNVSSTSTLTPQPSLKGIPSDISSSSSSQRRGSDGTLRAGEVSSIGSSDLVGKGGVRGGVANYSSSSQNGGVRRHASLGSHQDRRNGSVSSDVSITSSGRSIPSSNPNPLTQNRENNERAMYYNNQDPNRATYANVPNTRQPSNQSKRPYNVIVDPNFYPNGYNSLPRSRSTTPTPDPASLYNYKSLPRRSNSNTPTPHNGSSAYNNYIYGTHSAASLSGSLSRISESGQPGHYPSSNYSSRHHMDRNRPGTTSSSNNINSYDPYYYHNDPKQYPYPHQNHHQHQQQPNRPGSVPPHSVGSTNGPESIYSLARPFSVTPEEQLERQRHYPPPHKTRAGSVPIGYESETAAGYSSGDGLRSASSSAGAARNYKSDSGYDLSSSRGHPGNAGSNLRVQPGDEVYLSGPGKRPVPRRHTVTGSNKGQAKESETERKREAFMTLLAKRYPQYADRIHGGIPASAAQTAGGPAPASSASQGQQVALEKPARSRDPQRRRQGPAVIYDPRQATNTFEYDDLGTMSDLELPSFQRGGFMRTSLPIVRSASTSLERPLGLVFLVFGSQTKKSLLPNELTTLDTVRALFVRAFPDLTMEMMELGRRKIYVLDQATNIYFQLEDLGEIKDRSVLKLHETDDDIPQKVRERQEIRGRTVQVPLTRAQSHQENPELTKSHTLPAHATPGYSSDPLQQPADQWNARDLERRSRSRTPEPMERQRSLSAGASSRQRYSHSPERFSAPDRGAGGGSLNPIPENRQVHPRYRDPSTANNGSNNNYYETIGPQHSPNSNYSRGGHPPHPQSHYDRENPYAIYAAPPQQQAYIARSTRASTMAHPQRAIGPAQPDPRDGTRGANPSSSRPSPAFAQGPNNNHNDPVYLQRSQSYRPLPSQDKDGVDYGRSNSTSGAPNDTPYTRNRIEKMEQQLASLTAWVHYQKNDVMAGGVHRKESMKGPRSVGSTTSDSSDTFPASSASKHSEETSPTSTSSLTSTNHVVYATTTTKGLSDIHDGQRPSSTGPNSNNIAHSVTSSPTAGSYTDAPPSSSSTAPPPPPVATPMPDNINHQLTKLKSDLQVLRRQTQLNVEAMREEFMRAAHSIKAVISSVPGADNQVNFHNRIEATKRKTVYVSDKVQVDQELSDLESSVEELRNDVINHQCRVQISDVEGMALLLSNITKNLADLKTQFPEVHENMKDVMNNEMQLVVAEENFLKEEPSKIEKSLMRCKKLTGTLYTLKRLASVQDHRPPQIPNMTSQPPTRTTTEEDPKMTLLENIRALVPDHDRRVQEMEAREAARQRKKKISTQKEALKFGKSLEMATKGLRPCSTNGDRGGEEAVEERMEADRKGIQETPIAVSSQSTVSANPTPGPLQNYYFPTQEELPPPPAPPSSAISSSLSSKHTPSVTFSEPSVSSSSSSTVKPFPSSYSASLTTTTTPTPTSNNKQQSEKPTATVSAMPSSNTEIPRSVTSSLPPSKPSDDPSLPSTSTTSIGNNGVKSATIPLTEMTERLSSQVQAGTGPVTHSVSSSTQSPKKPDASVSYFTSSSSPEAPTTTTTTSSNTFRPPVFTKPPRQFSPSKAATMPASKTAPIVDFENFEIDVKERPKSSGAPASTSSSSSKNPPISKGNSLDSSPIRPYRPLSDSSLDGNGQLNGHNNNLPDNNSNNSKEEEKSKPYRKAARSAFSSAWVSPPSSPTPVPPTHTNSLPVSTINSIAQIAPGGTINLVLSGVASPKSPTNPGTFTITPPKEITTDSTPVTNPPSSVYAPTTNTAVSPKPDTETAAANKQKKVPPPPPPRKGSRPTSMTNLDINGMEQQQQQEQQEMPQFVGGILGQHRLSGGPLSSTPKPASQQRALSTFEKDIACGIYANLNRPDLQSQSRSPQQMLDKASTNNNGNAVNINNNNNNVPSAPLAPMVSTTCVDRNERGSSSESTSSSNSGNSGGMGSQQSVAGVMRSSSVSMRSSNNSKPKPEPPKRHSSLLSKSPVTAPDTRVPTRRKTLNGVDL